MNAKIYLFIILIICTGVQGRQVYCKHKQSNYEFNINVNNIDSIKNHENKRKCLKTHRPFGCDECQAKFLLKTDVQRHIWSKHLKIRNFQCNLCGRLFATKQTLKLHLNNHAKMIKYYVCSDCGAKFKMKEHHIDHMKCLHNRWIEDEMPGQQELIDLEGLTNIMNDIDYKIEDIDIDLVLNEVCDDQCFDFINYPEIDHDYFILDLVVP